jgi:voltage-gated potassium channel
MNTTPRPASPSKHADRGISGGAYSRNRYLVLFYSLLATLAVGPLTSSLGFGTTLLELFLAINLLGAVMPGVHESRGRLLFALLVVAVCARYVASWMNQPAASTAGMMLWTAVALFAAASAVRFAVQAASVDREHLYAALDAYLLAGVFLGVLYWTLERLSPGSLVVVDKVDAGALSIQSAIYFSFVTLATLGYGDLLPRSETARGIAIVEAVAGQLFLAVMVARLVSLYARADAQGNHD